MCNFLVNWLPERHLKGFIGMMTSSNGNILRVTGPLCGEFTGHRWIPRAKASDAELWCLFFYLRLNKRLSKQSWGWWFETPTHPLWRRCNGTGVIRIRVTSYAWVIRRLISSSARLFVQKLIPSNDKETTKTIHYRTFVLGIPGWRFMSVREYNVLFFST